MSDAGSHYELLGVAANADREEIREAYRARVDDLRKARERKGVSDGDLQRNRETIAKLNSAWNVLSDPFQRERYDARLGPDGPDADEGGDAGDEQASTTVPATRPTGWRGILSPAPANGRRGGNRPPPRPGAEKQPPRPLPPGMRLAANRARGMALLTDFTALLLILIVVQFVVPRVVKSDYNSVVDRVNKLEDQRDKDNNNADKAKKAHNSQRYDTLHQKAKREDRQAKDLRDDLAPAAYAASVGALLLALAYLVPMSVRNGGQTFGKRRSGVRLVRIDGSTAGWVPTLLHYLIPLAFALFVPSFGPVVGLLLVAYAFMSKNGQGFHDRLARTIVVQA
jgi:curved DNA-binding protein CbpA